MTIMPLQYAYVLHRRPFRETSYLLDLLTEEHGLVTAIVKGVRKPKSTLAGLVQPFMPLLLSWSGKSELKVLTKVEPAAAAKVLSGEALYAGFYLNELLKILLHPWDPHEGLYQLYDETVDGLSVNGLKEALLRRFEKRLIEFLGYAPFPKLSLQGNGLLSSNAFYRFLPNEGFVACEVESTTDLAYVFSGELLLAVTKEQWEHPGVLEHAKRLMRQILLPLLGDRAIYSRQLFIT